jgi:hypothetical protein
MPETLAAAPLAATRYAIAVHALASEISAELDLDELSGDAAWERADEALARHRVAGPHRWLFEGLEPIVSSPSVFDALEEREDGTRDWLLGSIASAAAAVVKFDVFQRLLDLREMGE